MIAFLRALVNDDKGLPDVGNFALLWVLVVVLGVISFDSIMLAVDYFRCKKDCHFDPMPLAQATGLVAAAFASTLPALGAYFRLMMRNKDAQ